MSHSGVLLLATLALGACHDDALQRPADAFVRPAADSLQPLSGCLSGRELDFAADANTNGQWYGAHARLVAFDGVSRVVDFAGTVSPRLDGIVLWSEPQAPQWPEQVRCPGAVSRAFLSVPKAAMFIDVNGDGRCGAGDVGISYRVPEKTLPDKFDLLFGWEEVWPPIGADGAGPTGSLCSDFFE